MTTESFEDLIMPSSPADRQQVMNCMKEIVNALTRAQAEKDHKKTIVDKMHEDFGIPKKLINKAANIMFKDDSQQVLAENDNLETFLTTLKIIE